MNVLLCGLLMVASPASAQTAMQQYVDAMQPGTNWGNTLDATPTRHSWGAPETTQPMIQGLVTKGYRSLRIPVTWDNYLGPAPDYAIDPAFMNHVQQVVDWSLDAGLYVMINLHHDSGWLDDLPLDHDRVLDRYRQVWRQIATRFQNHSNKLMFESINEPGFRNASGQDLPDATMATLLHEVNTAFHAVIRGTGGANATRPLVLPTVYTRSDQPMLDSLKATIRGLNDPNLIATVHYYGWYPFSVNLGGETRFDDTSIDGIHASFDAVHNTFVADGIPVIVGEFGILGGNKIQRGEQLKYQEYVQYYGRSKSMAMMLWDTGGIYGRSMADWVDADQANIIMQAVSGRAVTAESDLLFIQAGAQVNDRIIQLQLNGNSLASIQDNGTTLTPGADYTLTGETLTLKAHVLAKYAGGAFGEKATLKLNANSGPAWKIFVRYFDTPVPGAVTTTTKLAFALPVAFNGDQLATMEARHANGSNVGPVNWTSFQPFGEHFQPDYANNAIQFTENFFETTPAGLVNLSFHFWSGRVLKYQLQIQPRSSQSGVEHAIYRDGLGSGWANSGGWGTSANLSSTAPVKSAPSAISVTPDGWGAFVLSYSGPSMDTSAYRTLVFWIHGGTAGGQTIGVGAVRGDDWESPSVGIPVLKANTWEKVEIPLARLGVEGSSNITRFYFQNWNGGSVPTFHIDDIVLTTALTTTVMDIHGASAPVITSAKTATGPTGSAFTYTIAATNTPATFSATGLPVGLVLDATTGVISGTPTSAGIYSVTLGATNAIGKGEETLAIRIEHAPFAITTESTGANVTLSAASVPSGSTVQWKRNGASLAASDTATLQLAEIQPEEAGLYSASLVRDGETLTSDVVVVGAQTTDKVLGAGLELTPRNIMHPNRNVFDQVLVTGTALAVTSDYHDKQITRTSFIDLDGDIVQIEFSGPGTLSLSLDAATGPAAPTNYHQAVDYMTGHAGIVITGADERTNVSVFTVGRATAVDPTGRFNILAPISDTNRPIDNGSSLFAGHEATAYDGVADIAFIAISSTNGKFGGVRTANAHYFAARGLTGLHAPGVAFQGPVYVGDITAFDTATPVLRLGSAADVRITGGDLYQDNSQPVRVSGVAQLVFTAGVDSHGNVLAAKPSRAVLQQDGQDVTARIVVNPE